MERKTLPALNGLRVIATLGIFLFHADLFPYGKLFVTLFFMLSGFMMYYTKKDSIDAFTGIRKMKRLYPLHFVTMVVAVLLFSEEIVAARGTGYLPKAFLVHTFLLQAWFPDYTFTLNRLSWYLSVTLFLYAVSCPLVKLVKKCGKPVVAAGILCVGIAAVNTVSVYVRELPLYSNPLYRVFEYVLGMVLAKIYLQNGERIEKWKPSTVTICEGAAVLVLAAIYVLHVLRHGKQCGEFSVVFSVMLVLFAVGGGCVSRFLSADVFQKLAKYSFEYYMIHELFLRYIRQYVREEKIIDSILIALAACAATSAAIWLYAGLQNRIRNTIGKVRTGKCLSSEK